MVTEDGKRALENPRKYYDFRWSQSGWTEHEYHIVERRYAEGLVLDVGCGFGHGCNNIPNAVGLDVSNTALRKVTSPKIQADALNLPFRDKIFDTVIASELLEHVKDDVRAINELMRVCKQRLIISIPNRDHCYDPSHLREYDEVKIEHLIGHKPQWIEYTGSYHRLICVVELEAN